MKFIRPSITSKDNMSETLKCPYCQTRIVLVEEENKSDLTTIIELTEADSEWRKGYKLNSKLIVCTECHQIIFSVSLDAHLLTSTSHSLLWGLSGLPVRDRVCSWELLPESSAIAYDPAIVPAVIIEDYEEACKIISLSPKASATLYRRCLQWMIRDFHWIVEDQLIKEIKKLAPPVVPAEVWNALETVRTCWNIGAHMEKDVNIIIDIDEWEVAQLRWLIEYLIKEWYIKRDETTKSLAGLQALWAWKTALKKAPTKP